MNFIDNIKNCIGKSDSPTLSGFRLISFGFNSVYLEDVKHVISYTPQEITVGLRAGALKISGGELFLKKYCAGDVVICGRIEKIEKI